MIICQKYGKYGIQIENKMDIYLKSFINNENQSLCFIFVVVGIPITRHPPHLFIWNLCDCV
jgi:hypothetical protein